MKEPYSDRDIIELLRKDSEEAMSYLFRQQYAVLCRGAYRILGDANTAEDLVQEVFFELWRRRGELDIRTSLAAYLRRSVVNRSLNHLRNQRLPLAGTEDWPPAGLVAPPLVPSLEVLELEEAVRRAIDQLPERCRLVFVLSRFEELSHKEIAERLDISPKTVENQMTRALRLLREMLAHLLTGLLVVWALV